MSCYYKDNWRQPRQRPTAHGREVSWDIQFITRRRIIVCRISSSRGARNQKIGGSRLTTYVRPGFVRFYHSDSLGKRQRRASVVLPAERWSLEFSYLLYPTAGIPRTCTTSTEQPTRSNGGVVACLEPQIIIADMDLRQSTSTETGHDTA